MNRTVLFALVAGLMVGVPIGWFIGSNSHSGPVAAIPQNLPAPAAAPQQAPHPMGAIPMEVQGRLFAAQQAVLQNPKDVKAWIALGNEHFDAHQHQASIDAYAKALALDPNNPDVLTDQGVMYREMGSADKAIANFEKAQKVNPKHLQSLFNLGVVYSADLKSPDKARKAWSRLIEIAPESPQANQARQGLTQLPAK